MSRNLRSVACAGSLLALFVSCNAERGSNRAALLDPDAPVWSEAAPPVFRADFETSKGNFVVEVHRDWAPHGADRFYNLVRNGFYDDMRISRVRAGFIAQFGLSGDPAITKAWEGRTIPDDPVLQSNTRGYVSYAMTGPDTRLTQVYINYDDNSRLDAGGFAPFGRVVEGMEIVDRFYSGYDENAGGGMRGGKQGQVKAGGNAYLDREFPELDRIETAKVIVEGFPEPAIAWRPRHYVAHRSDAPIVIDGKITESSWRKVPWTEDFLDIEGPAGRVPRFRTRTKMLWDDKFFYVAADMEEPAVWATLRQRDAVIYHDNDFEIFIDPDGDTHEYYELEVNALGTEWDLFLVKPYRDGGPALNSWDIQGLRTAVSVDGTLNDPTDKDSGWSIEIALPWDVLKQAANKKAPPEAGDQWRVNFSRVEWRTKVEAGKYVRLSDNPEGRTRPEDNWVWSPQGIINMHYPEMWGIVQFSSVPPGKPAEFVPDGSDAIKWTLRRVYYAERTYFNRHGRYTDDLSQLEVDGLPLGATVEATSELFEASLAGPGGRTIRISQDGRVW